MNNRKLKLDIKICIDKIGLYYIPMRKKLKERKLQVWLDSAQFNFVQEYAQKNHLTVSELIRGWIHEVMKREGFEIKEPLLPEKRKKEAKDNGSI